MSKLLLYTDWRFLALKDEIDVITIIYKVHYNVNFQYFVVFRLVKNKAYFAALFGKITRYETKFFDKKKLILKKFHLISFRKKTKSLALDKYRRYLVATT